MASRSMPHAYFRHSYRNAPPNYLKRLYQFSECEVFEDEGDIIKRAVRMSIRQNTPHLLRAHCIIFPIQQLLLVFVVLSRMFPQLSDIPNILPTTVYSLRGFLKTETGFFNRCFLSLLVASYNMYRIFTSSR